MGIQGGWSKQIWLRLYLKLVAVVGFLIQILNNTVYVITFGSGKQLFPGLTATGINSVRGALPVEIIDRLHFKL